jgi:anti-sigma factor RsiW
VTGVDRCAWRDRLLEAESVELEGTADTEVGRHVATCGACAASAARILAAHAALDEHLDAHPAFDAAALVARARPARARRRPSVRLWAPLLAAAGLAALLLYSERSLPPLPGTAPAALAPPDVSAPEGTNFAVLPTTDPDITVVWLFQGE